MLAGKNKKLGLAGANAHKLKSSDQLAKEKKERLDKMQKAQKER